MNEEREELEDKLLQIQKRIFENRGAFTEHDISVIFAFSDRTNHRINALTGGTAQALASVVSGVAVELLEDMENETDLRKMFNLIAGKICRKFEQLIGEDDGDEEG